MTTRLQPVELRGAHATLEPLSFDHVNDLTTAAKAASAFAYTKVPYGHHAMGAYVAGLLADADNGLVLPFAQRNTMTGELVGCTRYLNIKWWPTGDRPTEVEVGGTWLAPAARRTGINTEAKLLLLSYAFEVLQVWRVAIATDERNQGSRNAIERIGATFEGVLRNHRFAGGNAVGDDETYRNTAMYSFIEQEWPAAKQHLQSLLLAPS